MLNVRFRRRSRSRVEVLQALHDEMARARAEMRASVVDAAAIVEGRLRKELDVRAEMADLVQRFEVSRAQSDAHDGDVLRALDRVAGACELLARRMEEEREERRALNGAIEHLGTALASLGQPRAVRPARDQVLGGTVDPARGVQLDLTGDDVDDGAFGGSERAVT